MQPAPKAQRKSVVTYLEMHARPSAAPKPKPRETITIVHAKRPTLSFYRYLYDAVGAPWSWIDRKKLSDEALAAIVQDPLVEVHVLYEGGVPAGYVELDRRSPPDIELAYFGLVPDFIGQGLGSFFLRWAIEQAFSYNPARFWLHTCTFDHPSALAVYERAGFVRYKEEIEMIDEADLAPRPASVG